MGRTAGRGMKGTKSRSGGSVSLGFEGGQSPLWRRTPKIGYMPQSLAKPLEPVNLDRLQLFIDQGRIDASRPITLRTLYEAGVVSAMKHGVKLLGRVGGSCSSGEGEERLLAAARRGEAACCSCSSTRCSLPRAGQRLLRGEGRHRGDAGVRVRDRSGGEERGAHPGW